MRILTALSSLLSCALLAAAAAAGNTNAPAQPPANFDEWTGWGGNVYNNRWNSKNTDINSTSVASLAQNCKLDYPVGVSATPVVLNYIVYYPTANGSFYALNIATCQFEWQLDVAKIISDFAPLSALTKTYSLAIARTSPQIDGNVLYFATQASALLVAVDLTTGAYLGAVQINNHPLAISTLSPTVYGGKVFVGTSSHEDAASNDATYKCCTFVGNFAAYTFNRKTKKFTLVWEVHTLPLGQGWSGVGVWGSQPSIDPARNQVFIGTGNIYSYPTEYEHCINKTASCLPSGVWQDSIVALDIATGKENWRQTITPLDGWVQACGFAGAATSNSPLCPEAPGPDADFGMAPTFVPAALGDGTSGHDTIIVGQKNGNVYSLNAATGDIDWTIPVGGDNSGSWLSWGVAVDSASIYYTAINYGAKNWTIKTSGASINNSAWGALKLKTGDHVWETPCPDYELAYTPPGLVNDILFVGQSGSGTDKVSGAVLALSKTTGGILNTLPVESVQNGGIVAKAGFVMFGTGYAYRNPFDSGSFYVYALPGAVAEAKEQMAAMANKTAASPTVGGNPPDTVSTTSHLPGATSKKSAASAIRMDMILTIIYPVALFTIMFSNLA
jgi:outer membrane protein assembly factor BamB